MNKVVVLREDSDINVKNIYKSRNYDARPDIVVKVIKKQEQNEEMN